MSKLYLVRRKLEFFIGPMVLDDLKSGYKKMEFGKQDEVSGHCGPWVTLENKKDLHAYYPELMNVFYRGVMDPWAEGHDTKKLKVHVSRSRKEKIKPKPAPNYKLAVFFLMFFVSTILIAYFAFKNPDSMKMPETLFTKGADIDVVQDLFSKGDLQGFNSYMAKNKKEILKNINSNKKANSPWMPFIRFFVFQVEGEIKGLELQDLKGAGSVSAPPDCSYNTWRNRWKESSKDWEKLVNGRDLPRESWARLLAWNPYWIKRRPAAGWIEPVNYYGACVFMAYRAFDSLISDSQFVDKFNRSNRGGSEVIRVISIRLSWLSSVVNQTTPPTASELTKRPTTTIGKWTCLESVKNLRDLKSCRNSVDSNKDVWRNFDLQKYSFNLSRLLFNDNNSTISRDLKQEVSTAASKIKKVDKYTRVDVKAEQMLLEKIGGGMSLKAAIKKVNQEYPGVSFENEMNY